MNLKLRLSKRTMADNGLSAGIGFLITLLLFMFMPLSYNVFKKKVRDAMEIHSGHKARIASIATDRPKQRQKKLMKQQKTVETQSAAQMSNMFSLDLSALSEDDGTGGTAVGGDGVIDESEADTPPIKRLTVPPAYPARARDAGVEGIVVARILIGDDGRVEQVVILEAPAGYGFERAVISALMRWKFEPAKLENMPVRVWARQEIRFSL